MSHHPKRPPPERFERYLMCEILHSFLKAPASYENMCHGKYVPFLSKLFSRFGHFSVQLRMFDGFKKHFFASESC